MSDLPVHIRPLREGDHPFILDSWCNTVRYGTPALRWVPHGIRRIFRDVALNLLRQKPELFRVLVNDEDENQIFAWVCRSDKTCHFVYVKEDFRRMGLASMLVERPCTVTHWTRVCENLRGLTYKPSLFMEVFRGLERQPLGGGSPTSCKHLGKASKNPENQRSEPPEGEAAGMVH